MESQQSSPQGEEQGLFFLQLQLQHIETGLQSSAQHIKTTGYLNSLQTA